LLYNLCCVNNLSLKTLDTRNLNKLNICVKLLFSILIFVPLPAQPNTDALWWVPYSLAPDELVHFNIKSDIFGIHGLLCEFLNLLDGTRGLRFEGSFVGMLGKVDGVVPADKVGLCFAFTSHFYRVYELTVGKKEEKGLELPPDAPRKKSRQMKTTHVTTVQASMSQPAECTFSQNRIITSSARHMPHLPHYNCSPSFQPSSNFKDDIAIETPLSKGLAPTNKSKRMVAAARRELKSGVE
jgi:hypothetical protein